MTILLVIAVALLIVAGVVWVGAGDVLMTKLTGAHAPSEGPLPFLFVPLTLDDSPITPVRVGRGNERAPWLPGAVREPGPVSTALPLLATAPALAMMAAPVAPSSEELEDDDSAVDLEEVPDGATVVFRRPVDEPVQLLPGRLEVIGGEPDREDIRFVGTFGERTRVVLGREGGAPHRVIRLHSPTVSRRHAQMEFVDGRWAITNLSATNPVLVNDEMLSPNGGETRMLNDGDRLELGEVVLRFRAR